MSGRPAECAHIHTKLLKCALEVDNSRAYWRRAAGSNVRPTALLAFEEYWFGARSLASTKILMANFRARFDAFGPALRALGMWTDMDPDTRSLVCHWHLQLADPLYRAFTGQYLVERHFRIPPVVTHNPVVTWVGQQSGDRWRMTTRIQFASKLLSSAFSVGLITSNRDPRPVRYPRVDNEALAYLMYLLRDLDFEGTLLDNPYLASVGLSGQGLEDRLKALPGMRFRRQGDLLEFGWQCADLVAWAQASVADHSTAFTEGAA